MVRTLPLLLGILLAVAAIPVFSGAADATVVRKNGHTVGAESGGIEIGVARGRVRVQCWQDGEKIIDEADLNVLSLSVASQINALRFRRAGEPERTLSIVSQNRTSCMLSPREKE
ncbi:hypothetical protein [Azospirillum canadense]|uniref:hypothetical protein n=1 Tax=Azospirillum canadense TaxID=403962 RepID=UPI002227EC5A|nr:hypothetical protein [Azospirillum canadense]MCW2237250.1 hypothetical protein [Azospirillum canadense]